jgi:hypothetical protein
MFLLCGFFILLSGIVSGIVAYFFPLYGILLFLTLAFAMLVLALGFLAVLLRFMPNRQAHDV